MRLMLLGSLLWATVFSIPLLADTPWSWELEYEAWSSEAGLDVLADPIFPTNDYPSIFRAPDYSDRKAYSELRFSLVRNRWRVTFAGAQSTNYPSSSSGQATATGMVDGLTFGDTIQTAHSYSLRKKNLYLRVERHLEAGFYFFAGYDYHDFKEKISENLYLVNRPINGITYQFDLRFFDREYNRYYYSGPFAGVRYHVAIRHTRVDFFTMLQVGFMEGRGRLARSTVESQNGGSRMTRDIIEPDRFDMRVRGIRGELGVVYKITPDIRFKLGFRHMNYDDEDNGQNPDLKASGFFIGALLRL